MVILLSTFWGLLAYQTEFWPALYMVFGSPKAPQATHFIFFSVSSLRTLHRQYFSDRGIAIPGIAIRIACRSRACIAHDPHCGRAASRPHATAQKLQRTQRSTHSAHAKSKEGARTVLRRVHTAHTQVRRRGTDASEPTGAPLQRPLMRQQRPFASLYYWKSSAGRPPPQARGGNRLWACGQKSDARQRSMG